MNDSKKSLKAQTYQFMPVISGCNLTTTVHGCTVYSNFACHVFIMGVDSIWLMSQLFIRQWTIDLPLLAYIGVNAFCGRVCMFVRSFQCKVKSPNGTVVVIGSI